MIKIYLLLVYSINISHNGNEMAYSNKFDWPFRQRQYEKQPILAMEHKMSSHQYRLNGWFVPVIRSFFLTWTKMHWIHIKSTELNAQQWWFRQIGKQEYSLLFFDSAGNIRANIFFFRYFNRYQKFFFRKAAHRNLQFHPLPEHEIAFSTSKFNFNPVYFKSIIFG